MIGEIRLFGQRLSRSKRQTSEETIMFKTISAALVAVSVLAAPALAGTPGKTVQTPVNKVTQAPVAKAPHGKARLLNANAKVDGHHKHYRHHRHHKHIGVHKAHAKHIAIKHVTPSAKRG
jgi:hypothetical protein